MMIGRGEVIATGYDIPFFLEVESKNPGAWKGTPQALGKTGKKGYESPFVFQSHP